MDKKYNINIINKYLTENNITKVDFCEKCNIPEEDLTKIYANNFDVSITTLYKIVKFLNIKANDFLIF